MTDLFLLARIAGRPVAIDAAQVDSVVDIGEVVAVPGTEPAVRGLAALRSRVVTVIDTSIALGLGDAAPAGRRAVITRLDGHPYAILVDAAEDVAPFERQPLAAGLAPGGGWHAVASGLIERDDQPVLVIDLAALIPQPLAA